MPDLEIPRLLYALARAGPEGIEAPSDPASLVEIALCLGWKFPVETRGGRLFLARNSDTLVPAWIEEEAPALGWERLSAAGYLEITSTNEEALRRARAGAPAGTLVHAETQSAGRGRKGRRWHSPTGEGLYFTLLVRPRQPVLRWPILTHVASLALAQALEEVARLESFPRPLEIDLKWPNDVLLSGRKTAGILLETASAGGGARAAAVGVGVNVGSRAVREDLRDSATSVSLEAGSAAPRRLLLVRFLYHFQLGYDLFERGEHAGILEEWKKRSSMCEGATVWVDDGRGARQVVTCGLSPAGALVVRGPDGSRETLVAGDVSLQRG